MDKSHVEIPAIDLDSIYYHLGESEEPQLEEPEPPKKQPDHPGKAIFERCIIDLKAAIPEPEPSLEIIQDGINYNFGTLGNFSLILGKPKSRKTFYVSSLIGAALSTDITLNAAGCLPPSKRRVLFFDTEQGSLNVQKAARRALALANLGDNPNFIALKMKEEDPSKIIEAIDYAIYNIPNIGLVVIDGIRDLVNDINNAEEATKISRKLLKWSGQQNIHIITVLHQNKGDNNARGHLGTELQNKAETVVSVAKDTQNKDYSIVSPEYCREREFQPFAFEITEEGLPHLVEEWISKSETTGPAKPKNLFTEISTGTHIKALKTAFTHQPKPKYKQLELQLKLAFRSDGIELGNNRVQEFITEYTNQGLIAKEGKAKAPSSYYIFTQSD